MKVKEWLDKNSAALQAVAAIIAICGVLFAVPLLWKKVFKTELVLQVNFDQSTVPPGLIEWSERSSSMLSDHDRAATDKSSVSEQIQRLRSSPINEKLQARRTYSDEIDKVSLAITNQTDHTLTGIRIRVGNMDDLWSAEVRGTYLTTDEAALFEKKLPTKAEDQAVIIPELPPIPPDGVLTIVLYGRSWRPEVNLSASGISTKIETLKKVKDSWFMTLYNDPTPLIFFGPFGVLLLVFLFSIKINRVNNQDDEGEQAKQTAVGTEAAESSSSTQKIEPASDIESEQASNGGTGAKTS